MQAHNPLPDPTLDGITLCPTCDLVQKKVNLQTGESAHCVRCNEELAWSPANNVATIRALLLTAVMLIIVMNSFPLVVMQVGGHSRSVTLLGAIYSLYQQDMIFLSVLVCLTTFLCPVVEVALLGMIFGNLKIPYLQQHSAALFKLLHELKTWSMVEVFMLGILVSLVKLAALADIILGVAIAACVGLIIILATLKRLIHPEQLWRYYHVQRHLHARSPLNFKIKPSNKGQAT